MLSVLTEEKREFSNIRMAAWLLDRDVMYHAREQYDSRYVEEKFTRSVLAIICYTLAALARQYNKGWLAM